MMTRAPFRLFRTGLVGSIILGLSAGGHLAGGGLLPEPAILAALCALTMVPVAVLTRFRLSFPVLAALLGAGQVLLHWSFHALSAGASGFAAGAHGIASPSMNSHAGHAGQASLVLVPEMFGSAMPTPAGDGGGVMFAAHAFATVAIAVLLARGEQALAALAGWFGPLLQRPERCTLLPVRLRRGCPAHRSLPLGRPGRRLPARRGPPTVVPVA
jgi:hypothetical protein